MNKYNLRKIIVFHILFFYLILGLCTNINGEIINHHNTNKTTISSELLYIPMLAFEPKFHDFGYVKQGFVYKTTFEIWNIGTDILNWQVKTRRPWVSVYPISGSSSGEHDTINVTINTTGLSNGDYEGNVYIHASGDYIFYTYFTVSDIILDFSPKTYDFGYVKKGDILKTSFNIWNNGTGNLDWFLESVYPWISIEPLSGTSTDKHDIVNITINTSELSQGEHSGEINIFSNGGEGNFSIILNVNLPPEKPVINGPSSGKRKTEYTFSFNSIDPDGDNIYYSINWGDNSDYTFAGPYFSGENAFINHTWSSVGTYTLKVKAIDLYELESDWEILELNIQKYKAIITKLIPFLNIKNIFFKFFQ